MSTPPLPRPREERVQFCECHGERMYWQKDSKLRAGGRWYCAVKKRKQERDRYDADPIHRLGKNLHDHLRRRAQTTERMRQRLEGDRNGKV